MHSGCRENMQNRNKSRITDCISKRTWAVLLLCAWIFCLGGCARSGEVYLDGLETQMKLEQQKTEVCESSAQETELITEEIAGYVYVCGAVKSPGVYPIRGGMRMFEALELAGGFTEEADTQWLNLAELLQDGQRLYIYSQEETVQLKEAGILEQAAADESAQKDEKVNINTADRETLMTLPGIGESKADAILLYRETQGGFSSIEEIQNISGIKNAVFSKIKDRITV